MKIILDPLTKKPIVGNIKVIEFQYNSITQIIFVRTTIKFTMI